MVCHRVAGSFHWEFNLIKIWISDGNSTLEIKPSVNRVLTDTGSSMLRFPETEYNITTKQICKYADLYSEGKSY